MLGSYILYPLVCLLLALGGSLALLHALPTLTPVYRTELPTVTPAGAPREIIRVVKNITPAIS